ncbi:MAG: multidrug efflux SMR transporter [Desulfovibrio sp.]|jgi:small multidrug resistance pump|nr:multidrug efflux SMR transporter [Desulfovibrio sp.]
MNIVSNCWGLLYLAIFLEVCGTVAIKLSDGFSRLVPSLLVLVFYCTSFWAMSLAVRKIDLGTAYAVWSGVGIVATSAIGFFFFHESVDMKKFLSIALIMIGVISLNLASAKS